MTGNYPPEWQPKPSITCPVCGMTSHHPTDIEMGYCGNCRGYTSRASNGWDSWAGDGVGP